MRSTDGSRVRTRSALVLISTLIGLLFTAGGLNVGFILGMVGSIMGLVWKPREKSAPTVPAPTEVSQPPRDSGERRRRAEREAPLNLSAAVTTSAEVRASPTFVLEFLNDFIGLRKSQESDTCWKPNVDWPR